MLRLLIGHPEWISVFPVEVQAPSFASWTVDVWEKEERSSSRWYQLMARDS
jgi:hypothetical protein